MSVLSKERLTKRTKLGSVIQKSDVSVREMIDKLAKYEDLEEQGLLLRLPVAVGSKVYEIIEETVPEHYYYISEYEVEDVSTKSVMYVGDWCDFNYPNLYFDRAEAEEKLRELEGK